MKIIPWLSTAAISFLNLSTVQADTLWVDTVLDQAGICSCGMLAPCCTLRHAIAAADPYDTITFRQTLSGETITLARGELVIDKSLTLDGDVDNDSLPDITLDTDNENRIIRINDALITTITGMIIQGGNPSIGDLGAGISIGSGGITYLKNSSVQYNGTWRGIWNAAGGGIYNGGYLIVENSEISANNGQYGGGIYNGGQLSITNSTVSFNEAKYQGAGIYNDTDATLNIHTAKIRSNKIERRVGDPANPSGAGVYNSGAANIVFTIFQYNHILDKSEPFPGTTWPLGGLAGAIFNMKSATIRNSLFDQNRAHRGGAIANNDRLIIENSTFFSNKGEFGGAIFNSTSPSSPTSDETMVIRNCTIYQNSAPADQGAGLYMFYAEGREGEHLTNNIIADNGSFVGGDDCIFYPGRGILETNSANLIQDGTCAPSLTGDPLLADLSENGGPTQTLALLPGSPAINSGNNGYISPAMTFDQRGSGFPRIQGDTVDIGAYEYFRRGVISFPIRTPEGKTTIISF